MKSFISLPAELRDMTEIKLFSEETNLTTVI